MVVLTQAMMKVQPLAIMFLCAGSVGNAKKKKVPATNMLSDVIIGIISKTYIQWKPCKSLSKCYKQLSEVNSLLQQGVLSEEEGHVQRNTILNTYTINNHKSITRILDCHFFKMISVSLIHVASCMYPQ